MHCACIYNDDMRKALFFVIVLIIAVVGLSGCHKSSSNAPGDGVQKKLEELAGSGAMNCGRLRTQEPQQLKPASDCAMQAAQNKRAFYVAYDLPGMTVGVAGNSQGKLYSVDSEQPQNAPAGTVAEVKSGECPAQLRIAQSGRVTCYATGSLGMGMGGSSPHGGMPMPPPGTPNPHGGSQPAPQKLNKSQ